MDLCNTFHSWWHTTIMQLPCGKRFPVGTSGNSCCWSVDSIVTCWVALLKWLWKNLFKAFLSFICNEHDPSPRNRKEFIQHLEQSVVSSLPSFGNVFFAVTALYMANISHVLGMTAFLYFFRLFRHCTPGISLRMVCKNVNDTKENEKQKHMHTTFWQAIQLPSKPP